MRRPRSSAWSLAAAWTCLMVYASLHPFEGWRVPDVPLAQLFVLRLPVPNVLLRFDIAGNLFGYVPLGGLLAAGVLRSGGSVAAAFLLGALAPSLLSYTMETLQHLLPMRVSSILDWELNTAGATLGALAALVARSLGAFERWQRWRERWFLRGRGFGLALLLMWPFGLLFPPPLPFGLGQMPDRLREAIAEIPVGTPLQEWLPQAVTDTDSDVAPLAPGVELLASVTCLLAPTLLAFALTRPGVRRLALLGGALLLGVLVTTLSTALNFGPDHALAWVSRPVAPAIALTAVIALPLAWVPARVAAVVALPVLSAALALVDTSPDDAYYAASLQSWEQGRFIRFHGLAQWIGWLWPWAALAYLVGRVASRREPPET